MKLFIVSALIAVASAARLEHLERSYLPPSSGSQNNYAASPGQNDFPSASAHGNFGLNQGQYNAGSNGIGSGHSNGQGSNGFGSYSNGAGSHGSNGFGASRGNGFGAHGSGSNGFGSHSQGSNGFGSNGASARGSNGFGAPGSSYGSNGASGRVSADAATSNQYLPPNYSSGSGSNFGSSIRPACSTCGSSFGSPQRYSQQPQSFGSQNQVPSTNYGSPQTFGSPSFGAQQDQPESVATSRQYLAPKSSNFQNIPQQPFDEQTGYHY